MEIPLVNVAVSTKKFRVLTDKVNASDNSGKQTIDLACGVSGLATWTQPCLLNKVSIRTLHMMHDFFMVPSVVGNKHWFVNNHLRFDYLALDCISFLMIQQWTFMSSLNESPSLFSDSWKCNDTYSKSKNKMFKKTLILCWERTAILIKMHLRIWLNKCFELACHA